MRHSYTLFFISLLFFTLTPSVTYASGSKTITRGDPVTITWNVTNAPSCTTDTDYPVSAGDSVYINWRNAGGNPSGSQSFSSVWNTGTYTFICTYQPTNTSDSVTLYVNDCPATSSWNSTSHTCVNPAATVTISPASNQAIQLGSSTTFTSLASDTGADITGHNFNWLRPGGNANTSTDWNWGNANPQSFYGTTNVAPNPSVSATASDSRTITFTPNTAGVYTVSFSVLDNGSSRWTSSNTYTLSVCASDEYIQGGACVKIPVATLAVNQSNGRQITWTCTDASSVVLTQNGTQIYTKTFSGNDSGNYTMLPGKTYTAVCTNSYGRTSNTATFTAPSLIVANGTTDGRLATYTWSCPSPATAAAITRVNGTTTIVSSALATSGTVSNNSVALGTTYDYALACTNGSTKTGTVDAASLTTPTPVSLLVTSPSAVAPTDTATITWTSDGTVCQLENYNRTQILKSGITKVNGYFTASLSATSTPSLPQSYGIYGYYIKCSDGTAPNRLSTFENLSLTDADQKAFVTVTGATIAVVDVKPSDPAKLTWQCTNADRATLTQTLNGVTTTIFSNKVLPPFSGPYDAYPGASYDLSCTNTPNIPATAHYDPPTISVSASTASEVNVTASCVDASALSMILSRTPGWTADASSTVSNISFVDKNNVSGSTSYIYTLRCYDGPVVGGAQTGTLIGYVTKTVVTPAAVCTNGAINPTTCNVCPSNLVWDGAACVTPSANPTVTLSANPTSVRSGNSATLSWGSQNATGGCTASGDWSGSKGTSGTASTGALTTVAKIYTLTCSGGLGSNPVSTSVTVSLQPEPTGVLTPSSCTIASGASTCSTSVSWEVTNPADTITISDENSVVFVSNGAPAGTASKSIGYGPHIFSLKDGSTLVGTATYTAGCALGTEWKNGSCTPPTPPNGTLNPSSCTITSGQSSCSVSVVWGTQDTVATINVKDDADSVIPGTSGASGTVSRSITRGTHVFSVNDGSTQLATASFQADCALGASWNGTICADPTPPSGTLRAASCAIALNQSSCAVSVSWTTSDTVSTIAVKNDAGSTLAGTSGTSGTVSSTISRGTRLFSLYDGGTQLDATSYTADCTLGTAWDGYTCVSTTAATGKLYSASCVIATGASTCSVNVTWETQNATSTVRITRDYGNDSEMITSNGPSNGGTYNAIFDAPGDYALTIRHNTFTEVLGHATYSVSCAPGTLWIGGVCAVPLYPTGTLFPASCTILEGQSSCQLNVTWQTLDATSTVSVTRDYAANSLFASSTGVSNGGTKAATFNAEGTYNMTLSHNGDTLGTASYNVKCALGTLWLNGSCQVPKIVTGILHSSSCTIASGASTCSLNIVWETQNATTTVSVTRDYDNGSVVASSTGVSNGGTKAVTFSAEGTYAMSLAYAGSKLGESVSYSVNCASGTTWRNINGTNKCAPPDATGSLTPDSCIIAINQSSCPMTITWSTANAVGPVAVVRTYDSNTTITGGTGTSGEVTASFPSGSFTLALMDNNKTVTLDSKAYVATCANNSTWNGTKCERNSAVFGVEAYITETGSATGTYSLTPTSPLTTNGSFGQWGYRTTGSGITNCVMHQQDDGHGWYGGYDTDAVGYTKTYASYTALEKNNFANAFSVAHDWRVTCYGGNNQSASIIWSLIATSTPEIVVEYTCNNGATNPTACDVCPNGQTIGTTATGTPNVCVPICANGAGNPVACTATCPDGSIPNAEGNCAGVCPAGEQLIDGVCGVVPSECTNGAINFSACDICSPGDYYSTSDNACHTPVCGNTILETGEECDGTAGINDATRQSCGAATSATACTISCKNGATDAPNCGACPAGKILISGTCVNMCNNGAVQSSAPACTACPVGKLYRNGFCIFPICGNGILEGNEVCDKQAGSYNHTTYQCNDICQTEPFGTLPEAEDDGVIPSIRVTCPNSDKYEIIRGSTGAVVAGGTYTVPITYTPTVADTYKMSCIKVVTSSTGSPVEVKSTPVLRSITAAVFTPHVVSLNATPKTVQKGSPVTLTWDIANPNELCTIIATPIVDASCGFICSLMRNNDASRLTGLLSSTKTDTNDPYGNGDGTGRPMRDALSKVLTNDGHARGKKTIQVNYSTTFTASCSVNALQDTKSQEVKVQVATSNEG